MLCIRLAILVEQLNQCIIKESIYTVFINNGIYNNMLMSMYTIVEMIGLEIADNCKVVEDSLNDPIKEKYGWAAKDG